MTDLAVTAIAGVVTAIVSAGSAVWVAHIRTRPIQRAVGVPNGNGTLMEMVAKLLAWTMEHQHADDTFQREAIERLESLERLSR